MKRAAENENTDTNADSDDRRQAKRLKSEQHDDNEMQKQQNGSPPSIPASRIFFVDVSPAVLITVPLAVRLEIQRLILANPDLPRACEQLFSPAVLEALEHLALSRGIDVKAAVAVAFREKAAVDGRIFNTILASLTDEQHKMLRSECDDDVREIKQGRFAGCNFALFTPTAVYADKHAADRVATSPIRELLQSEEEDANCDITRLRDEEAALFFKRLPFSPSVLTWSVLELGALKDVIEARDQEAMGRSAHTHTACVLVDPNHVIQGHIYARVPHGRYTRDCIGIRRSFLSLFHHKYQKDSKNKNCHHVFHNVSSELLAGVALCTLVHNTTWLRVSSPLPIMQVLLKRTKLFTFTYDGHAEASAADVWRACPVLLGNSGPLRLSESQQLLLSSLLPAAIPL